MIKLFLFSCVHLRTPNFTYRAAPGSIEARIFKQRVSKDLEKFASNNKTKLMKTFDDAESGVFLTSRLTLLNFIAKDKPRRCSYQVGIVV